MKITPEYIRTLQEANRVNTSEIVDTIMEGCVNNLVCNGKVYVSTSKLNTHGITYDAFRDELRSRGFHVSFVPVEDSSIEVSLPPSGEDVMKPQNDYFGKTPPEPPPIRKVHSW